MLFYSCTGYSAALRVFWEMQPWPSMRRKFITVHHRQGCKKGQRGKSNPSFALSPRTSFSFFLFFLHNLFWKCLHGIWINSGRYFCVRDIVICLIQMTAWLSTVLVLSSSDWYKMAMLFLEFWGLFLFFGTSWLLKWPLKQRWVVYETWIEYFFADKYIIPMVETGCVCSCPLNFHFICYCYILFIACFLEWTLSIFAFTPLKQWM